VAANRAYTPAVAAVQPWFDRNRGVASGIALSGTGLGTLLMPLLARWLIDSEGWRAAFAIIGLGVAGFGFVASNWIRLPAGLPTTSSSPWSHGSLRKLAREPSFRRLYVAGFLSSLVLLVPIVHMIPHAVRAGVAARDAAWLISILGFGSLAGRLMLGHAADRLRRQAPPAPHGRTALSRSHTPGLQMARTNSTTATPAMTIKEAAPAPAQKPAAQPSA